MKTNAVARTLAIVNGRRYTEAGAKVVQVIHRGKFGASRISQALQPARAFQPAY